jgi:hypothetical protein
MVYKEIKATNLAGRFLKVDPETNLWNDIGMKKALKFREIGGQGRNR